MPNWCENVIEIRPKVVEEEDDPKGVEQIKEILSKMTIVNENGEKSLSWREVLNITSDDVKTWINITGCKWDISELCGDTADYVIECCEKHFRLYFSVDSAWGPYSQALIKLTDKYRNIEASIEYIEPGMAFAGRSEFVDGVEHVDIFAEYPSKEYLQLYRKSYGQGLEVEIYTISNIHSFKQKEKIKVINNLLAEAPDDIIHTLISSDKIYGWYKNERSKHISVRCRVIAYSKVIKCLANDYFKTKNINAKHILNLLTKKVNKFNNPKHTHYLK